MRKVVNDELVAQDPRYLMISIFKAESDWSYGMHLKQLSVKKNSKLNTNRQRVHSLKRFKRASITAKALSAANLDVISSFELEAYAQQMQATFLMEVFQYEQALDLLLRSKFIYEQIGQGKDLVE